MNAEFDTEGIKALGEIETIRNDINRYCTHLEQVPLWQPSAGLKRQGEEVGRIITELEERFERKLVITLVGPTGSGKSTLLNALAGLDDLSPIGSARPTTRNVVVFAKQNADARQLREKLGVENVEVRSSAEAHPLKHIMLIDTPDTDSTEMERHIALVIKAIELSDMLICVFDAENPKRRDHVDFLSKYVRLFNGESLVVVINKCDRQNRQELAEVILPEFTRYIEDSWQNSVQEIACISARSHLTEPKWEPQASPRHDFDQYPQLRDMIMGKFDNPGYVVNRRVENARMLRNYVLGEINSEAGRDRDALGQALEHIRKAEQRALMQAVDTLREGGSQQLLGVNVLLYQKLAQRWMGPVGWLIALWARILIFGTGLVAIFRFGNPLRQLAGIASSLLKFRQSRAKIAEESRYERIDAALKAYSMSLKGDWPDISEKLVQGRFNESVRRTEENLPDNISISDELSADWNFSLDKAIERSAKNLSGWLLQIIFNIPAIAILCFVGWITLREFLMSNYLSSGFFLHALLVVMIVLFLSFFLLQLFVRLAAGTERIVSRAFETLKGRLKNIAAFEQGTLTQQVMAVIRSLEFNSE